MTAPLWVEVSLAVVGGLALFLLGIQQLARALQNVTSDRLRTLLLSASRTRLRGAASGIATTAVIQSSTATVVLLVGFTAAGAMTLRQAIPVVLGANVGTTITLQIIAFDVTNLALAMIAVGYAGSRWGVAAGRETTARSPARALLALGLMFLGLTVITQAVAPLRELDTFAFWLTGAGGLLAAMAIGCVVTAVVQSSSATGGLVIVLGAQGLIDLETAIAVMLGASIGTGVTPLIAGLGTSRAGLRVAAAHLGINTVAAAVWLPLIPATAAVVTSVTGGDIADPSSLPRQIAHAYTFVKGINLIVLVGLNGPISALIERWIGDKPAADDESTLDDDVLDTPDIALELSRREVVLLADAVIDVVEDAATVALHGTPEELELMAAADHLIDRRYERLVRYLGDVGRGELSDDHGDELLLLLSIANDLEAIGDLVETNLVGIGRRRLTEGVLPSAPTTRVVTALHHRIVDDLREVRDALANADPDTADRIRDATGTDRLRRDAVSHLVHRLRSQAPNRVRSFEREMEIVGQLDRIAGLTRHCAAAISGLYGSRAEPTEV